MMKNRLHIVAMAMVAATLASCSDSYPGLDYTEGGSYDVYNGEGYDATPIMVFINEQNLFSVTTTRGTGPFEKDYGTDYWTAKYQNAPVYVYAFRSQKDAQGLTSEPNFENSRWNDENLEYDCLLDGADRHGMLMKFTKDQPGYLDYEFGMSMNAEGIEAHNYMKFYSKQHQEVPYNFFAYYIDKNPAETNIERRQDYIKYTFTIDGSQDIMCGYAPFKTKEELMANENLKGLPEDQINKILNIGGFSTYSAHRGLNPVIDLKHRLVRLNFRAYPGDKGADAITIKQIYVTCRNTCELTVAGKNLSDIGVTNWLGEESPLYLAERSNGADEAEELHSFKLCDAIQDGKKYWDYATWKALPNDEKKNNYYNIGSCLMVPPASEYKVTLVFKQPKITDYRKDTNGDYMKDEDGELIPVYESDETAKDVTATYTVKLQSESMFQAGYSYPITIAVYGYQEIKMSANIAPWIQNEDGDIEIGDDDADDMGGF